MNLLLKKFVLIIFIFTLCTNLANAGSEEREERLYPYNPFFFQPFDPARAYPNYQSPGPVGNHHGIPLSHQSTFHHQQTHFLPAHIPTRTGDGTEMQPQVAVPFSGFPKQIPLHPLFAVFWIPLLSQPGIVPTTEGFEDELHEETGDTRVSLRENSCMYFVEKGSCKKPSDCTSQGGTPRTYCRDFSKFCCIFHLSCGQATTGVESYFRNQNYPLSNVISSGCKLTIGKADSDICGINVIPLTLTLPANTGYCDGTGLYLNDGGASGKNYEPLCGDLSRKPHTVAFERTNTLSLEIRANQPFTSRWNVLVSQLSCSEFRGTSWPLKGPSGPAVPVRPPPSGPPVVPVGPPPSGTAVQSPPVIGDIFAPGLVGPPGEIDIVPDIGQGSYSSQCGLSGIRSQKPTVHIRNQGQAQPSEEGCLAADGTFQCRDKTMANPLLQSLEWVVPVPKDSLLAQYAGVPQLQGGRITYGEKTKPHQYPWNIAMFTNGRFHCGASLISDIHVLTAAHCVKGKESNPSVLTLSIGDWNINSQTDGTNIERRVSKIVTHPGYSTLTLKYDVAVLTLTERVQITDTVRPVCLPDLDINLDTKLVTVTGWGRDEHNQLQSVLMAHTAGVVSNSVCNKRWLEKGAPANIIAKTMMCMDPQSGDSCKGDSGGPCIMESPPGSGKYLQVGIVSFGSASCVDKNLPGVYTKVGSVIDWVKQQIV